VIPDTTENIVSSFTLMEWESPRRHSLGDNTDDFMENSDLKPCFFFIQNAAVFGFVFNIQENDEVI
jgi:hypothetical protein